MMHGYVNRKIFSVKIILRSNWNVFVIFVPVKDVFTRKSRTFIHNAALTMM